MFGTVLAAAIALLLATPLAVGIALFISHYAPRRLAATLGYLIDLLAAVPSVVYGLWGAIFVAPHLTPIYQWLEDNVGFLPFFAGPTVPSGAQHGDRRRGARGDDPADHHRAVPGDLPADPAAARGGRTGARRHPVGGHQDGRVPVRPLRHRERGHAGLGRALGETLAVTLVLSPAIIYSLNTISSQNSSTITSNIALQFPEASGDRVAVLIATGLVLFVITFAVNFARAPWSTVAASSREPTDGHAYGPARADHTGLDATAVAACVRTDAGARLGQLAVAAGIA